MWQHLNVAVATSYWQHATTSRRGFLEGNNTPTAADSCNRTMMALTPLAVEIAAGSGGMAAMVLMQRWIFNSCAFCIWPLFVYFGFIIICLSYYIPGLSCNLANFFPLAYFPKFFKCGHFFSVMFLSFSK
jgi:hypothetical protein